jgi:hypothetical protein
VHIQESLLGKGTKRRQKLQEKRKPPLIKLRLLNGMIESAVSMECLRYHGPHFLQPTFQIKYAMSLAALTVSMKRPNLASFDNDSPSSYARRGATHAI